MPSTCLESLDQLQECLVPKQKSEKNNITLQCFTNKNQHNHRHDSHINVN